jgi:hypothetical protein
MNKDHAKAYAFELAQAIEQTVWNLQAQIDTLKTRAERIRKQPNDSMVVFEHGFKAIGEIAELNRAARTEQVARAFGTAMHFAKHQ